MSAGGPGRDTAYDGQWNERMNYYILPPLVGLPFDEMVRNGEGARHGYNKRYQTLIIIHAVFMAIPFLFLIPFAVYFARYTKPTNPRKAIQLHMILNTTALIFLTVGFVSGWFAMNKGEWGANPHHLIGAVVYGGVVVQAFFGFVLRQGEKNKIRKMGRVGLRAMLHAWFGRGLLAVGLAQIPLGLFVYGAQLGFFVAYAVVVGLLFIGWFVSEYIHSRRGARYGIGNVRGGNAIPVEVVGGGSGGAGGSGVGAGVAAGIVAGLGVGRGRRGSHSSISYTEMTETTHPAPTTATPGTFISGTSYDDHHGTDYTSTAGTRLPATAQMMPLGSASPRVGRLNRLSQSLGNRWRRGIASIDGGAQGTEYSYEASTRPPTGSTTQPSGLHAPPSQTNRIGGKIATLGDLNKPGVGYEKDTDPHHFRRNDLSDLKDTTTHAGTTTSRVDLSLPTSGGVSSLSPVSSATTGGRGGGGLITIAPLPRPQSDVSSLTSDNNPPGRFMPLIPPPPRATAGKSDPSSGTSAGATTSYLSDQGPASPPPPANAARKYHTIHPPQGAPRIPLPMPPPPAPASATTSATGTTGSSYRSPHHHHHHHNHRRIPSVSDTSTQPDAVIRIPLSRAGDAININHGELIRNNLAPGETPNVSVQVKVDRTGKSVTVRRVPEEEARLQRARERAERAGEREREIEFERGGEEAAATSALLRNPAPVPVTPVKKSGGGGGSGGVAVGSGGGKLAQRKVVESDLSDEDDDLTELDDDYLDDDDDESYVGGGGGGGGGGSGAVRGGGVGVRPPTRQAESSVGGGSRLGRESVVSAGAQTDDAEAEERIRERRRRKRREERKEGGLAGAGQGGGGTYYGDGGAAGGGSGAAGSGSGSIGAAGRNIEWT